MERKCENSEHEGENPPELTEEEDGFWWLKDPEWKFWCPRCSKDWFRNKVLEVIRNN